MNSLVPNDSSARISGSTLAATKLAHEFGHVNRTGKVDSTVYQLQTNLIPQYNKIFLSNGRNPNDPKLVELSQKIGGTPVQIWEDREYWGEANAMMYLRDRVTEENLRCALFSKIRHSVDLYAKDYEPRFLEIARVSTGSEDLRLAVVFKRFPAVSNLFLPMRTFHEPSPGKPGAFVPGAPFQPAAIIAMA